MRPSRLLALAAFMVALALPLAASAQMSAPELVVRIDRLEEQIRQLTGSVEQLQYRNQQLEQQIRRLESAESRPADVAAARPARGQLAAPGQVTAADQPPPPGPPALPGPTGSQRRSDAFDPGQNPNAPGAPQTLGSMGARGAVPRPMAGEPAGQGVGAPGGRGAGAPLDLATLSANAANESTGGGPPVPAGPPPRTPNGGQLTVLAPSATPRDEYDLAYGYILRRDYALAEEAFRVFLKKYPGDRMVAEAHYWLGESLFQRQRYRDAAEAFLNVSTKYETSAKASDALLRLGESLAAIGERDAACATLSEVARKYPRAGAAKQAAEREQKRAGC